MEAGSDISNVRGNSTNQQPEVENLRIRKQALIDRQRESMIVALAVEDSAILRRIDQVERRAKMRCKNMMQRIRISWLLINCWRNKK